jgi:hypothetical protein
MERSGKLINRWVALVCQGFFEETLQATISSSSKTLPGKPASGTLEEQALLILQNIPRLAVEGFANRFEG